MPIHIIWGNDINESNKEIEKIINIHVSKLWKSLNISRFNGEDHTKIFPALEETQSPPMGDGSRIVILYNNPIFNYKDEELKNYFEWIAQNIPESSYLILQNSTKPDSRIKSTKFLKQLLSEGKAIESSYNTPDIWDEEEQIRYVNAIAKNLNIKIDNNAVLTLITSLGLDSFKLNNELEKAKLYLSAKNNNSDSELILTENDIKKLFTNHLSSLFGILDLLLEMKITESLYEIHNLLNQGEPPLKLTAGLISQIRIHTIVLLLDKEKDTTKICSLANISNPKRIFFIKKKMRYCSPKYLINVMIKLLDIESLIKKGNNPKDVFTENFMSLSS